MGSAVSLSRCCKAVSLCPVFRTPGHPWMFDHRRRATQHGRWKGPEGGLSSCGACEESGIMIKGPLSDIRRVIGYLTRLWGPGLGFTPLYTFKLAKALRLGDILAGRGRACPSLSAERSFIRHAEICSPGRPTWWWSRSWLLSFFFPPAAKKALAVSPSAHSKRKR